MNEFEWFNQKGIECLQSMPARDQLAERYEENLRAWRKRRFIFAARLFTKRANSRFVLIGVHRSRFVTVWVDRKTKKVVHVPFYGSRLAKLLEAAPDIRTKYGINVEHSIFLHALCFS